MRIGIVGMGWVGTSTALSLLHRGVPSELLLVDLKRELAEGEAMDLSHGASFLPTCLVRAAELAELRDADAVIIAAGRGSVPGETRLDLTAGNAQIIRSIAQELRGARGTVILLTNPVDVMTRVFWEASGLDPARVIGTGTMLETARLRYALGRDLGLDPRSIHAQVIGEHGDSSVMLWSSATVGGAPLRGWSGWSAEVEPDLTHEVRRAAYEIIQRKGATNHAIGLVTTSLLRWTARSQRVLTVSRVHEHLGGVAISLPTVVGPHGAGEVVLPPLDDAEQAAFAESVAVLERVWRDLG